MRKLIILAVAAAAITAVNAQMVFDTKFMEVKAAPDDETVTADFPFTIKGSDPVTIAEYDAPCSCLEAKISDGGKLTWKPGETGTVKGIFRIGKLPAVVDKEILLRFKGERLPVKLTIRLHSPILFEVSPPTLFWDQGGEGGAQVFKIKVNHDKPIKITEISGTNEQFDHEVKTIKEGWEYELTVTPKSVKDRAFGMIRIRNDSEYKRHQSASAYVVIRRPQPDQGKKVAPKRQALNPPAGGKPPARSVRK